VFARPSTELALAPGPAPTVVGTGSSAPG
jgi:hypothetical protein